MSYLSHANTDGNHTRILVSFATGALAAQNISGQQHQLYNHQLGHKVGIVVVLC